MIESNLVRSAVPPVLGDVGGDPDDVVLVRQYLGDDLQVSERASALLFERFRTPVFDLAWYMLRNRHDAEDAMQVTFEKAFNNLDSYRSTGSLKAWITRICRHHCIDQLRSPARARTSHDPLDEAEFAVRADVVDQDLSITLWTAFQKLPIDQREAVCFVRFLGFTSHEAAEAIGVRASTVRSRVGIATAKLEREVRENGGSGPRPKPNVLYELPPRAPALRGTAVPPDDDLARRRSAC